MDTVYVVVPVMSDDEPAAFEHHSDAENYASYLPGSPMIYDLLVCDSDLARKMIREASAGDDE